MADFNQCAGQCAAKGDAATTREGGCTHALAAVFVVFVAASGAEFEELNEYDGNPEEDGSGLMEEEEEEEEGRQQQQQQQEKQQQEEPAGGEHGQQIDGEGGDS